MEVGTKKFKVVTNDIKKLYKVNSNKRPTIPFYDSTNTQ